MRGTIKQTDLVHRVIDVTDPISGQCSQGALNKYEVAETYVKQDSYGYGAGGSSYIGADHSVGALSTGFKASSGADYSHVDAYDKSVTLVDGISVAAVVITVGGAYVGNSVEVIETDLRIDRNNRKSTDSLGGFSQIALYAQ